METIVPQATSEDVRRIVSNIQMEASNYRSDASTDEESVHGHGHGHGHGGLS